MKIIAYGIRNDEEPFLKQWVNEHPEVDVKVETNLLDENTVDKSKGFDGIVAYQQKPYSKQVINKFSEYGIKNLSLRNVGIDNLDIETIKKNKIKVTNVPSYSPAAIAELTLTSILELLRNSKRFQKKIELGDFSWEPDISNELNQMTIGVYATGRIGKKVIDFVRGFGAKIIAYDIYQDPKLKDEGIYVDTPKKLYENSDILTLHAPAVKENYHLINDDTIDQMKPGIKIINPARGDLIDTDALIRGLDSGRISGAALDVIENEVGIFNNTFDSFDKIPDENIKKLISKDNVIITPHIAFYTKPAVKNMVQDALNANLDLIKTGISDKIVKFD
ncbi:lactate dehydrogenase [Lactobacillus sp. S2-2]|uniref:D-2-hydroxyacid dehydrogenase n=1 Tax=Lactobacillus sp. S2-2 TaxID=2692917 RepID=UPI001F3CEE01|nr:lactate dehydrogenase [Lactobacillus sp. S2-2]